jgi:hypothetical protein
MTKEYLEKQFKNYYAFTKVAVVPEMFGAKGDGVTDDSTALTNAINAAKTLRLPLFLQKNYYSSTEIVIPQHMLVIGNSIAPTGTSNQKAKTWNIKSPNGFRIISHTTLKNLGLLETKLTINGSRNQIEDCVFSEADMAVELYNTTSTKWTGEVYFRGCYWFNCLVGIHNEPHTIDGETYPIIIDSEVSGCTAINSKKLQTQSNPNPLQNDIFMTGRFTAIRVVDNHLYMSAVAKDCVLADCTFWNNYFDNVFPYFDCEINGKVIIQNNEFFTSGKNPNWDGVSDYHVNEFTRSTSGNRKWLNFSGNSFNLPIYSEDNPLLEEHYYFVHTKTPLAMSYTNNINTIKDVSSDADKEIRYLITDYLEHKITYNNQTLKAIRSTNGIAISGNLTMPSGYGSSSESYGSHNIPCPASYTTRFYATLVYKDSSNAEHKADVYVKLLSNGTVAIEKAPSDYANSCTLFVNTIITNYQLDPKAIQVTGGN